MRPFSAGSATAVAFAAVLTLVACAGHEAPGAPPIVGPTKTPPSPTPGPTVSPTATPTPGSGPVAPTPIPPGPTPTGSPLLVGYSYVSFGGATGGWLSTALANAFAYPVQSGFGGTGQTIAIIGAAYPARSDLTSFWSISKIPAATVNFLAFDGGNGSPNKGEIDEATLDAETISGLAPYAVTDVIAMPGLNDQYVAPAIEYAVDQLGASVVSMSFGGCETDDEQSDAAIDGVAEEAAATGVTLVASAGDSGTTCDLGVQTGVQEPASDPYVVGVGGTESLFNVGNNATQQQIDADLQNPAPWNETTSGDSPRGAGGGGISQIWAIPSYQYAPGALSSTQRNVPDIAFPASVLNGPAAVYLNGAWSLIGGTSWSAPQFAAMQAEINQVCGHNRWGLPDLYRVAYQFPAAFVDVTTGEISWPGFSLEYYAGTGYDNASGLGMPLGLEIAIYDGC